MTEVITTLAASPARRILAVGALGLTAALLLAVGVFQPPISVAWQFYLLGFGGLTLWLTWRLWHATAGQIVLTPEGLFDTRGRCLCPMENIAGVERGVFAFKPSNGFLVHMKAPMPRGWAPGLWWSVGRRLGVGGVTPATHGRLMADLLAAHLHDR